MTISIELKLECRNCGRELDCEYIESIDVLNVEPCENCIFDAVNHAVETTENKSRHSKGGEK